jgi:hypothetical protein
MADHTSKQTALIVWQNGPENNVTELNTLLGDGWRVVSLNRMSQECHSMICALAILERRPQEATNGS